VVPRGEARKREAYATGGEPEPLIGEIGVAELAAPTRLVIFPTWTSRPSEWRQWPALPEAVQYSEAVVRRKIRSACFARPEAVSKFDAP